MIHELEGLGPARDSSEMNRGLLDIGQSDTHETRAGGLGRFGSTSASSGLTWAAVAATALVLGALAYGVVGANQPEVVLAAYLAAAPIVAGLTWSARRPGTQGGAMVILTGTAGWLVALPYLGVPEAQITAALAQPVLLAVVVYSLVALPIASARSVARRWAGGYAIGLLVLVSGSPEAGAGASLGVACWWAWRFRDARRLERGELIFIGPVTLAVLAALLIGSPEALIGVLVLVPLAYLATLLQAEIAAGRALSVLLEQLSVEPSLASWQRIVAEALGDPTLRLVSWDADAGRLRDVTAPAGPPEARPTEWIPVQRGDDLVAVLSVDQRAVVEPEVVRAAGLATRLAVEHEHLDSEFRKSLVRLAAAADGERRRIARDLHDCAQQRLVTLRIHLSLAGESVDRPQERRMIEELGNELDEALVELREVSQGFYPVVLSRYGVAAALRSASRRTALPVRIEDHGLKRHGEAIDHTLYFCCLEALQNAAKHAGSRASAVVRLIEKADEVRFEVEDDGIGFVPHVAQRGSGLLNLADRLMAVGGSLLVDSTPGHGARISGRIGLG